jgi:hypothetical protein
LRGPGIHTHDRGYERKLDEREVVRGELIVARSDATTLFDFVKEALDEIAGSVEMRTEADWIVAIAFGGMLAQAPFLMANSLIQSAS